MFMMENKFYRINNRLNFVEEKISEFKNVVIEII